MYILHIYIYICIHIYIYIYIHIYTYSGAKESGGFGHPSRSNVPQNAPDVPLP